MRILLLITIITSLLGCESPPVRRSELIAEHPNWNKETIKIINEGFIVKGMTTDHVRAAWGRPCLTCTGTVGDQSWEYPTQIVFFDKDGKVDRWTKK